MCIRDSLVDVANGDARGVLNALELAVETTPPDENGVITIDLAVAEESIQRRAVLYDKDGDVHYDTISAFIKSLRGSDPDAALYYLAVMLTGGEDPKFIARRMVIFASEDVGNADPRALEIAVAILVRADHQEFERVLIEDPVGQQALEIAHPEFVDLHTGPVAHLGFTGFGLAGDRAHGLAGGKPRWRGGREPWACHCPVLRCG